MQEGVQEGEARPSVLTFRFIVFLIILTVFFAILMTLLFFMLRS